MLYIIIIICIIIIIMIRSSSSSIVIDTINIMCMRSSDGVHEFVVGDGALDFLRERVEQLLPLRAAGGT